MFFGSYYWGVFFYGFLGKDIRFIFLVYDILIEVGKVNEV